MISPQHHVPSDILAAYMRGTLPEPFAVVVATHISLCDECRSEYEAAAIPGGLLLEELPPTAFRRGTGERHGGARRRAATGGERPDHLPRATS